MSHASAPPAQRARAETVSLAVKVAPPRIALSSASDHAHYPWRMDIPALRRTVLYDDNRFLLLDEKGGEIAEREGVDIALSPTRRFLAFFADDHFQVLDLLDGAVVASLPGGDLSWGYADSFVVSVTSPWARVWIASTFKEGLLVEGGRTACAACWPADETALDINLENGFILVAGPLGYTVVRLDDRDVRVEDGSGITADNGLRGTRILVETFLAQMGTVSPVSLSTRWGLLGGLSRTNGSAMEGDEVAGDLHRDYVVANTPAQKPKWTEALAPMTIVSTKGAGDSATSKRTLLDALAEFGLTILSEIDTVPEIEPHGLAYEDPKREATDKAFAAKQAGIHKAITADLKASGIRIDWSGLSGDSFQDELGCPQFEMRSGDLAESVDYAFRIDASGRTIWVVRTACTVAHTLGTIRTYSEFAVFDSQKPVPVAEAIVATESTMRNMQFPPFYEDAFRAKLIGDRWLAIYTPGGGRITVFDLETRKISFRKEGIPRGDLLSDVHIASDQRHLLQENTDGSFLLYRLDDASVALSGRSIEDEIIGAVAKLVGIGGGVVSGCFNPNESSVDAPDRRPRHDEHYHEARCRSA